MPRLLRSGGPWELQVPDSALQPAKVFPVQVEVSVHGVAGLKLRAGKRELSAAGTSGPEFKPAAGGPRDESACIGTIADPQRYQERESGHDKGERPH